jgi:hypothetical protein
MPLPYFKPWNLNLPVGASNNFDTPNVRSIYCSAATERFLISLNGGTPTFLRAGFGYFDLSDDVKQVTISTAPGAVAAPNVIELLMGSGSLVDNSLIPAAPVTLASGAVVRDQRSDANMLAYTDFALVADTDTSIAAANANRRSIRLKNIGAGALRIGSTSVNVGPGVGLHLGAGESVELFNTGAIWAHSQGAAGTLNVTEFNFNP